MKSCLRFLFIVFVKIKLLLSEEKFFISKNIALSVFNFGRRLCSSFLSSFHFLCKGIIFTGLLSVNKYEILYIFHQIYLVCHSCTCSFVLFGCKFCNKIFILIYTNNFFHGIFHFHYLKNFYFDPC